MRTNFHKNYYFIYWFIYLFFCGEILADTYAAIGNPEVLISGSTNISSYKIKLLLEESRFEIIPKIRASFIIRNKSFNSGNKVLDLIGRKFWLPKNLNVRVFRGSYETKAYTQESRVLNISMPVVVNLADHSVILPFSCTFIKMGNKGKISCQARIETKILPKGFVAYPFVFATSPKKLTFACDLVRVSPNKEISYGVPASNKKSAQLAFDHGSRP